MSLFEKKNFSHMVWLIIPCLLLSGCSGSASKESAFTAETLGLTPDFSYERKAEKPNIQVNCR